MNQLSSVVEYRHFHLFCGLGGGAKGFNKGHARVGSLQARWRCIGGVDNDPAAIRDFSRAADVQGTVLDMFSREQFVAFHGREPAADWREATPDDIRRAAHGERPHAVFLSAPCKGFSGLLPEASSATDKYQALNGLTLRGVWLMLEAWKDDPPELIVFENVPRIAKRGRKLLDQIVALLRSYGYAVRETTHDCGELGGLGQSRKRFLLVARHEAKVPPFLYEPEKRRLRGVGEILEKLPRPGDMNAGPMHRMPALQWKTWVRLAFVEAGSDWRSLNKLTVENGMLRDFGILPDVEWQAGVLGVHRWTDTSGVVAGRSTPTNGSFSVADPRVPKASEDFKGLRVVDWGHEAGTITTQRSPGSSAQSVADPRVDGHERSVQLGVRRWDQPAAVVKGDVSVGSGPYAVSDPRMEGKPRFNNTFRIVPWAANAPAVAGPGGPAGGLAVADPRPSQRDDYKQTKYRVTGLDEAAGAVIGASTTGNGAYAVADPAMNWGENAHGTKLAVKGWDEPANVVSGARILSGGGAVADPRVEADRSSTYGVRKWDEPTGVVQGESFPTNGAFSVADPRPVGLNANRDHYKTGGHYGVVPWDETGYAVPGFAKYDRGHWSVADPRDTDAEPLFELPKPEDRLVAVIRALDNTWHRPFTTLELAALQSLVDPDELDGFKLDGQSDSAWRERIGNAVPPHAAAAIASVMATTLLLAMTGETFMLSSQPIWVRDVAVALAVDDRGNIPDEDISA
ncbi:DNA cytosine methyltransferase [Mesorhizobium sp. M4A.F.Ca.ET.090.04.2.1]|uniref:DNA cytosine methyltransferase n=1 Tax=Mesorhizobium sp. M4A.F.Ca.ET.090.04.2.1 TaxID=2496663 RepID=UPI000FCC1C19|nr:DNA cytosine methyltransferase [Mesorhizobium sp. M4A.F.Ca.ET.090.04.2.1]RVC47598.1 DNA cytosine methyltransferase [Mesorhizobium sp. M4A.F.Ca.ET.090.04.2.1]